MSPEETARLRELSREECLRLLATQEFGRLAVVEDGQPLVFPVNFAVDGDIVVFRADPGTKLAAASLGRVAFEVDDVDVTTRSGWSVVVVGVGQEITSALDHWSERLRAPQPVSVGARGEVPLDEDQALVGHGPAAGAAVGTLPAAGRSSVSMGS